MFLQTNGYLILEHLQVEKNMDSGPSWADQWDYNNPDPLPCPTNEDESKKSSKKQKKEEDGSKSSLGKTLLGFKWVKELRKKSEK
ncbi:uncharacterized protein LOC111831913 [Capsella rubella]|uniref:uncharacterized protein LOC111831913 n=1 Tax=Capsella rubella TaxID=81985 RepID=UPI000CD56787|nr:uncharacterized protein LOC111831913 [Capsella rubella]